MIKEVCVSQIESLTTRIERQLRELTTNEKNISQLEKDLLLENLRVLYQHVYEIDIVDNVVSEKVPVIFDVEEKECLVNEEEDSVIEEEHPVKEEEKVVDNTSSEIDDLKDSLMVLKRQFESLSSGKKIQLEAKEDLQNRNELEVLPSNKQEEVVVEKEKIVSHSEVEGTKTIGENFVDNAGSLNDRLSEKKIDNTLASKIKENRITDLKSAIDINRKFLFIRELFNNDAVEYHNTIDILNDISSVDEMLKVVTEKSEEYSWDEENEAFVIFSEMINRKIR